MDRIGLGWLVGWVESDLDWRFDQRLDGKASVSHFCNTDVRSFVRSSLSIGARMILHADDINTRLIPNPYDDDLCACVSLEHCC